MKLTAKVYAIMAALALFIGVPLALYALGDAPRRSLLKESLSVLTLLALSVMLGQFFLARSNHGLHSLFRPATVQKVHRYIGYSAIGVIFLHPFMIVLPRYLEGGIRPVDAFITMITTIDRLGIVLGLVAWAMMVVLCVTVFFRMRLRPLFSTRYKGWRYFHAGLAVSFTILALWHAIELGRHTNITMAVIFVTAGLLGLALLAKLYWGTLHKRPLTHPMSEGAAT